MRIVRLEPAFEVGTVELHVAVKQGLVHLAVPVEVGADDIRPSSEPAV